MTPGWLFISLNASISVTVGGSVKPVATDGSLKKVARVLVAWPDAPVIAGSAASWAAPDGRTTTRSGGNPSSFARSKAVSSRSMASLMSPASVAAEPVMATAMTQNWTLARWVM